MNVFEMAIKYYPRLWNEDRINTLVQNGKLTEEEARKVFVNGKKTSS